MTAIDSLLKDKRALVLGGGRGIGRAISLQLAEAGANLVLVDLERERAESVSKEIAEIGVAHPVAADVRRTEEVERAVSEACEILGGIDVLVTVVGGHNAFAPWQPLHETTDEQWDLLADVNLRYVFTAARAVLRVMLEQGSGGAMVFTGSVSGMAGAPNHSPYGAAKAGVIHLARSLALEYGRYGIRCNVVSPGSVMTPAVEDALAPEARAAMAEKIPLGRSATPEDIARVVLFFASPLAGYVSGQVLAVDGGAMGRFPLMAPGAHPSEAV
jgi:NAD(P)-dependent dehydrogenase (short-subunit alcohol dehydrogenase family)